MKLNRLTELYRRQIAELTEAGENMKNEIDAWKQTVHEMSCENLADVGRYMNELSVLRARVQANDSTIANRNAMLATMDAKMNSSRMKMARIRAENASLNERISQCDRCVNGKFGKPVAKASRKTSSVRRAMN